MESFWMSQVFEIHHLILIICVLLMALIMIGGGKGLGKLLGPLVKKILGREEVSIIIGGGKGDMAITDPGKCPMDPARCPAHQAEKERSLRNEKEIGELWAKYNELAKEIRASLATLTTQNAEAFATLHNNQLMLLIGLVKSGVLDEKYVPKDVGKPIFKA